MTVLVRQILTYSYVGIPFITVFPLHSRFISTKISHSLLRVITVKGTGIPFNFRNSSNSCYFWLR